MSIKILKAGISKIRNSCRTGVLAYHFNKMDYLCYINNYAARVNLGKRLPFEAFWGETPDISMIRFKFWDPVYYLNCTDKEGKVIIRPGRFLGFTCNIGEPMTFKLIQCKEYPHKRNIVIHKGVLVPRSLKEIGYNSSLVPKSDTYLPYVQE